MSFAANDPLASRALQRVGTVLCGRYRLVRLIGIGGMGAVYAGTHRNGHAVAVKVLHERLSTDPEVERLFRREAQIANTINHPGVVGVMDDDVAGDGCVFLVMPLLDGETLRARWERQEKRVSIDETVAVANALLEVLAVAHSKKIVHRDIKPENIFISTDGSVRVLDFGIARFFETNDPASATRSGRAVGTPAFMAPEQALGRLREVDGQTDLWAVGATMFSLLSGRYVHEGDSGSEIIVHAATRPARALASVAPDVPTPIAEFVDRALAFDKSNRWPNAEAMSVGLRRAYASATGHADTMPGIAAAPLRHIETEAVHAAATQERFPTPPAGGRASKPIVRTERLPGPPTRTTTAAVLGPGSTIAPSTRSRRIRRASLAIGSFALLSLLVAAFVRPRLTTKIQPSSSATQEGDGGGGESRSSNPEAQRKYEAGLIAFRDASFELAETYFEQAGNLDPDFAAAHLLFAIGRRWTDASQRDHYQVAVRNRATLSHRDLALLDAYAPSMQAPPNYPETERRLLDIAKEFSTDSLVQMCLADLQIVNGNPKVALGVLDRILGREPRYAAAWSEKAAAYELLGATSDQMRALKECSDTSPSDSCLLGLGMLQSREGQCSDAEESYRKILTINRNSYFANRYLANAIFARKGPIESVWRAWEQSWSAIPPHGTKVVEAEGRASIAILTGDFAEALRRIADWEKLIDVEKEESSHMSPARLKFAIFLELGRTDELHRATLAALREREAWIPDSYEDLSLIPVQYDFLAGTLTRDRYKKRLADWLLEEAGNKSRAGLRSGVRWIRGYAQAVSSKEDASEALNILPQYAPLPSESARDVEFDDAIGHTYLLGDQLDQATPYLHRGAASCLPLEKPIAHTYANLHYAMALDEAGKTAESCDAYQVVAERWGREPRSRGGAFANQRRRALRCEK